MHLSDTTSVHYRTLAEHGIDEWLLGVFANRGPQVAGPGSGDHEVIMRLLEGPAFGRRVPAASLDQAE
jgi:hypothetical protein